MFKKISIRNRFDRVDGSWAILLVSILMVTALVGIAGATELVPGDRGSDVKQLQNQLAELGYDVGLIDGVYGGRTRDGVRKFQIDQELTPTGKVNELTWMVLFGEEEPVATEDEDTEGEDSLDVDFDFADWGMDDGGTSMEIGGEIQTGYGSKFSDSDLRFPVIVYIDDNTNGYSGQDATDNTTFQQNHMQLWWKGDFAGNINSYAAFDLNYFSGPERPFSEDLEFEIDEAYVTHTGEEISWTIGKEKISWGVMDVISPFDILNSGNFLDPFVNTGLHDKRGQWGIHFNWDKVDKYRLEVFLVPVWNRSVVPQAVTEPGADGTIVADYWMPPIFAGVPEIVYIGDAVEVNGQLADMVYYNEFNGVKKTAKDLSTFALGTRYMATKGEYDLGAYFITSMDPKPTVAVELRFDYGTIDLGGNIGQRQAQLIYTRIQQDFSRVYTGGFSAETVKGKFRLKHETALTYGRRYFPDIVSGDGMTELFRRVAENSDEYGTYSELGDRYAALHLLFGSEYTIPGSDIITALQLSYRHRFGYEEFFFGEADYVDLTLYAQKSFAEDRLITSFSSLIQTTGGSGYVSPRVRYTPRMLESLELGVGVNVFFGDSEEIIPDEISTYSAIMGSFQKYSHVFLTGKYLFGLGL